MTVRVAVVELVPWMMIIRQSEGVDRRQWKGGLSVE